MSHILVGFSTKKDDWISRLICWATGWRHSHVALISPDRKMIAESTAFPFPDPFDGEIRDGARVVPIEYMYRRHSVEIRKIEHPSPALVWDHAFALAKQKTKYDHEYIGAWAIRKGRGDTNKVACNELIEIAAARAGHALYPPDVKFTTPRDLYLLSKEI